MGERKTTHPSQLASHLCSLGKKKYWGGGSSNDTLVCLLLTEGLAGNFLGALVSEGTRCDWGRPIPPIQVGYILCPQALPCPVLSFSFVSLSHLSSQRVEKCQRVRPFWLSSPGRGSYLESPLLASHVGAVHPRGPLNCRQQQICYQPRSEHTLLSSSPAGTMVSKSASEKSIAMPTTSPGDGFKLLIPPGIPWVPRALDLPSLLLSL